MLRDLRYRWYWRLRHWWMDTTAGLHAKIALAVLTVMLGAGITAYEFAIAARPLPAHAPRESIVWMVVWLIVALVVAVVAIATMPKPKAPTAKQADTPTVEDGQQVLDVFGTVWIPDSFIQAWKIVGKQPIKTKGGKK